MIFVYNPLGEIAKWHHPYPAGTGMSVPVISNGDYRLDPGWVFVDLVASAIQLNLVPFRVTRGLCIQGETSPGVHPGS
ncbi:hypothetical protein LZP73_18235 [Shewanella sp. AS16]|uniref:hypothetical protein n=1 Tax=Shewanella sp. AS16 TaxID=2907625 RepID=UPI001F3D4D48|nr:hypothetical protein [Shewanella sp. AS16]MCE9688118.1 hypothetical protein [Shewanella sp. AS16]